VTGHALRRLSSRPASVLARFAIAAVALVMLTGCAAAWGFGSPGSANGTVTLPTSRR
jgi:hypothetical protein